MFGMAAFAFEGAAVVIPTESSMRKPQHFNKVSMFFRSIANVANGYSKFTYVKNSYVKNMILA